MNNLNTNFDDKHVHTDETLEAALDESVEAAAALSIRANELIDRLMQRLHVKVSNFQPHQPTPSTVKMFNPDAGP